jgi:hypothetical protein
MYKRPKGTKNDSSGQSQQPTQIYWTGIQLVVIYILKLLDIRHPVRTSARSNIHFWIKIPKLVFDQLAAPVPEITDDFLQRLRIKNFGQMAASIPEIMDDSLQRIRIKN